MKKTYTILLLLLLTTLTYGKTPKADRLYNNWEYFEAAKLYQDEVKSNPSAEVYYKLGLCYMKMNCYKNEEKAAFDQVNSYGNFNKPEFYLYYGQVLRSTGNYAQAKIAFDKYSALVPSDKSGKFFSNSLAIATEDHYWDEKITTSNISMLNTEEADFSPVIYKDGIVFTTSRKTTGHPKIYPWTGNNYLDLYYAKRGNNDTTFTEIEAFGGKDIVKKYHDGPASFSKNFDTIFTSRVEKDLKGEEKKSLNIERNKIYSATMENNSWSEPIPFPYNSKLYSVAHPFITKDGSRLYFVSNMPGGFGETDIYYCERSGKTWGTPVNCGPNVNTFNREKYPSLDEFGNLYFSSDGYQGFGGADICVALNKNNKLEKAIPMKFPFNSTADDFGITFTKTGKAGYISSNRIPGGFGDDDILYFDLSKDAIDSTLVTSIYTMGYKPKPVKVIATPAEPLAQVIAPLVPKPVLVINNATPKPHGLMVFFDFDKSNIRKSEYAYLDSVVNYMKSSPSLKLIIGGYTDSKGTPAYNMNLSNQRNQSVLKYLSGKGISKSRMKATAYGLTNLLNYCVKERQCSNYESRINRRVELDFEFAPQN